MYLTVNVFDEAIWKNYVLNRKPMARCKGNPV